MFRLDIAPQAARELKKIPKQYRDTIRFVLRELKENPNLGKPLGRELTGKFSIKIGVYRIIYKINYKDKIIYVPTAGHRGTVYRRVRRKT